jgi:hypothetical protein
MTVARRHRPPWLEKPIDQLTLPERVAYAAWAVATATSIIDGYREGTPQAGRARFIVIDASNKLEAEARRLSQPLKVA